MAAAATHLLPQQHSSGSSSKNNNNNNNNKIKLSVRSAFLAALLLTGIALYTSLVFSIAVSLSQGNNVNDMDFKGNDSPTSTYAQQQQQQRNLANRSSSFSTAEQQQQQQQLLQTLPEAAAAAVDTDKLSDRLTAEKSDSNNDNNNNNNNFDQYFANTWAVPASSICPAWLYFSPMYTWQHGLNKIHQAAQSPRDGKYTNHDATLATLETITPRLPHSVQALPRNDQWSTVARILQQAKDRYVYLTSPQQDNEAERTYVPPIKIIVLGGSVTMGVGCNAEARKMNCDWPSRLQNLLTSLTNGHEVAKIYNVAFGGANTAVGEALIEYDALGEGSDGYDIIINAYSTNDMHIQTVLDAAAEGKSLGEKGLEMAQDFVRRLFQKCLPKKPLLIWLDDYLGNEQREILATTELSQYIHVLANYYGFASVSFAHAVRDLVYRNTTETMLSPNWYNSKGNFVRQIHPDQGVHLSVMFMVAYNLLNMASTYCSLIHDKTGRLDSGSSISRALAFIKHEPLPPKKGTDDQRKFAGMPPKETPLALPPMLTKSLNLQNITELWQRDSETEQPTCDTSMRSECFFSWVNGLDKFATPESITKIFEPHVASTGGWQVSDESRKGKFGWSPPDKQHNATLTLEFKDIPQTVRKVGLFILKSYGPRWEGSEAAIHFYNKHLNATEWTSSASHRARGDHTKQTTEMYVERIVFEQEIPKASNFKVDMTFLNGVTFKLQGIAVCS